VYLNNKTVLASAVLLALSTGAQAQPANELQTLRNTVEQLQKQLEEIKAQLAQPAAAPVPTEGESQESLDARTPSSKADVQGLRTDMENYKYDQSRLQERTIPSVTRNTKIGGTLTVAYQTQNPAFPATDTQTTAPSTTTPGDVRRHGFRAVTGTLNFAGNLYRDYAEGRNLTYRLGLNIGSTSPATNNSQVNLTDAYIRYSYEPATGNLEDRLGTLTLGQQPLPFGLDAPALDPEVRAVINSALFVEGFGLNQRQIGLVAQGDFDPYVDFTNNYRAPLLGYTLAFFNGNGANKADNNSSRDWLGRIVYTLPVDYTSWFRQLQLGTTLLKAHPNISATTVGQRGDKNVYGVDVNWTHLPFTVAYEWAYGKEQLATAPAANPDGIKRGVGQYVNIGYTWGEQFLNSSKQQGKFDDYWPLSYQAFLRYDVWDPNRSATSDADKRFITTLGLNVFFAETTRFQINYFKNRNQAAGATFAPRSNGIQAQFVAGF
jgi:hypothetical protein